MKYLAVLVVLAGPGWADEIHTKDGKKIEGTILKDLGEAYELENDKGAKITIKKDDIEKVVPISRKPEAPLTGASFTFEKKRKLDVVDLLPKVDLKKSVGGVWKPGPGMLVGTSTGPGHTRVPINVPLPEEYDLNMVVERKDGVQDFYVGLVGGGRQFTFHFDAFDSTWTGPHVVDGKLSGADNGLGISGAVLAKGVPRLLTFMVRKEVLIVRVDNKDYFAWKVDWSRVSLHPSFPIGDKGSPFLGLSSGSFQVSKAAVSTPKE